MSQAAEARSTKDLFKDWRGGDAEAGQLMAQRFADWYYAIATSRLGEGKGRRPCEVACQRFGEGIVKVGDGRKLIPWAHEIIKHELDKAGARVMDGDEPNAYTNNQAPKSLLARSRFDLAAEVTLLEACYGGRSSAAEIEQLAAPLGGNPIGVLRARYRVKQWLRDRTGVPFDVAPDQPILDRAPLPLYESGRMATLAEEDSFEQWMISDLDLCRDIAEFAQFAIALRGGVPDAPPRASQSLGRTPAAASQSQAPESAGHSGAGAAAAAGGLALVAIGAVVLLLIVAIVGLVLYLI